MRSVPVTDDVWWVGAIDWNLRDFHGYETPRGTTYNAYLVRGGDTVALVDTVKLPFTGELLSRVASVVDPADIGLIVVNHVEPDHNSGLRAVLEHCPNARVVASRPGVAGVAEYHDGLVVEAVGADDSVDLGGKTLRFLPLPMVHWPDSMATFCEECCTLMPNDAFGQHIASSARFADDLSMDLALEELAVYYANILMPIGTQVGRAVDKIVETGWDCKIIAPSHGVIWRQEGVAWAIDAYRRWTAGETKPKVVVAFATMWGSTDALARAVADGVSGEGVDCCVFDLSISPVASVTRQILDARALLLGSPTLHHGMLYRVAGYLQYLEGLRPPGKQAGVFGSFGWGGGATKQMRARLEAAGFEVPFEDFTVKYRPTDDDLAAAAAWGAAAARAVAG